jgi:hypothetical protein
MGWEQPVGLISDAIDLQELIATIRGGWLIKDGNPVTDPYDAQQEASFSFFGMFKTETLMKSSSLLGQGILGIDYTTCTCLCIDSVEQQQGRPRSSW